MRLSGLARRGVLPSLVCVACLALSGCVLLDQIKELITGKKGGQRPVEFLIYGVATVGNDQKLYFDGNSHRFDRALKAGIIQAGESGRYSVLYYPNWDDDMRFYSRLLAREDPRGLFADVLKGVRTEHGKCEALVCGLFLKKPTGTSMQVNLFLYDIVEDILVTQARAIPVDQGDLAFNDELSFLARDLVLKAYGPK